MTVEILVNATPRETRAALLENGVLQEIYVERASRRGLVSNLYKGRMKAMSAACRNAVRSSPMSTNAACMPGSTDSSMCAPTTTCGTPI